MKPEQTLVMRPDKKNSYFMIGLGLFMAMLTLLLFLPDSNSSTHIWGYRLFMLGMVIKLLQIGFRTAKNKLELRGGVLTVGSSQGPKTVDLAKLLGANCTPDALLHLVDVNGGSVSVSLANYSTADIKALIKVFQYYIAEADIELDDLTKRSLNSYFL